MCWWTVGKKNQKQKKSFGAVDLYGEQRVKKVGNKKETIDIISLENLPPLERNEHSMELQ
jgi:hypothetical protein